MLLLLLCILTSSLSANTHVVLNSNPSSDRIVLQAMIPSGSDSEEKTTKDFHKLIGHTLFQGSTSHTRDEILDAFELFKMDPNPEAMIHVEPTYTVIRFSVPCEYLPEALNLLKELSFNSELSSSGLEMERDRILEKNPNSPIRTASFQKIQSFYEEHLLKKPTVVCINGNFDLNIAKKCATQSFQSPSFSVAPTANSSTSEINQILEKTSGRPIESHTIDGQEHILVDGKILMTTPAFYQKESFQKKFGWTTFFGSIVAAVGGIVLLFGSGPYGTVLVPLALLLGSVFGIGTGVYSLSNEPLNDPLYVIKTRRADLSSTFTKVYQSGHFRYTLTPLEWRKLFIREHCYHPSIQTVSEVYDLWSRPFGKMFNVEEQYLLKTLITSYREEKTILVRIRDHIEEALTYALEPVRQYRDEQLECSETAYESDYFVIRCEEIKNERHNALEEIGVVEKLPLKRDSRKIFVRNS